MAEPQLAQLSLCSAPQAPLCLTSSCSPFPHLHNLSPTPQRVPTMSQELATAPRALGTTEDQVLGLQRGNAKGVCKINPINPKSQSTHKYYCASMYCSMAFRLTVYHLHRPDWCNSSNLENLNQQHPFSSSWESLKAPFPCTSALFFTILLCGGMETSHEKKKKDFAGKQSDSVFALFHRQQSPNDLGSFSLACSFLF